MKQQGMRSGCSHASSCPAPLLLVPCELAVLPHMPMLPPHPLAPVPYAFQLHSPIIQSTRLQNLHVHATSKCEVGNHRISFDCQCFQYSPLSDGISSPPPVPRRPSLGCPSLHLLHVRIGIMPALAPPPPRPVQCCHIHRSCIR